MGQRPSTKQIKLFRSICRKLGVPPGKCLSLQDELDREEMTVWIRNHQPKAKLLGLSEESLREGICRLMIETRRFPKSLSGDAKEKLEEGGESESDIGKLTNPPTPR